MSIPGYRRFQSKEVFYGYQSEAEESFHELVIGELPSENWKELLCMAFLWSDSPEGEGYWRDLHYGRRVVNPHDYEILVDYYELHHLSTKEITEKDII